jgi:hypothetical protein
MALIDSEGFGLSTSFQDFVTYNALGFPAGGGIGQFNPSIHSSGTYGDPYLTFWNSTSAILRLAPAGVSAFFFGARTRLNGVGGNPCYLFCDTSFVNQFAVRFNTDGSVTALRGRTLSTTDYTGGTVLGSSSALVMPVQGWQYVEIGGVIDASAGSVVVKVNGTTVLNLTGVNTRGSAAATMRRYGLQSDSGTSTNFDTQHWYLCDDSGGAPWNTFLGDVRVQSLYPTANDAVAFTPTGLGTNWQNAASVPPVPFTDYNASSNVSDRDTFEMQDITTGSTVYGVNLKPLVYKNDAGARSGASVLKSGATTDVGTTTVLSETAAQLSKMYETDPHTSAQWTATAVNAIKAGYQVAA